MLCFWRKAKTDAEIAREFFAESTPEAFKRRFLRQAKGDASKAKILEDIFDYEISHVGDDDSNGKHTSKGDPHSSSRRNFTS